MFRLLYIFVFVLLTVYQNVGIELPWEEKKIENVPILIQKYDSF